VTLTRYCAPASRTSGSSLCTPSTTATALARINRLLAKTRFWQRHRATGLSAEQTKVLNRLLDGGPKGFEDGISASQYQAVAKVSKATATRHLAYLLEKICLMRLPGGGRSTRYGLALE
jgi:Fic family protein